jgi:hypothetical protein
MVRIFRRLRIKLLNESKLRNYFFYAFGEIVLVVIGILIALQINNWNQLRKDHIFELKMLSEISNALKGDLLHFQDMTRVYDELYITSDYFMELSKKGIPYHDSLLGKVFELNNHVSFQFNSGPYEALKSSGMDRITDDSIRMAVTNLYDFELPQLGKNLEFITRNHYRNIDIMLELFGERLIDDSKGYNFVGWTKIREDLYQS